MTICDDLRQSVLQAAIQGKLTKQLPEDGTAVDLLASIEAEKEQLIKEKKIKKEKPLEPISEEELPFDIPESWKWVRLGEMTTSVQDGDHQPPPQTSSGVPFLVISNISSGKINFSQTRYVPVEYYQSLSDDRHPSVDDLLFTVTGSYGIVVKVETETTFCFQRHIALIKPVHVSPDFLAYVLTSNCVKKQCDEKATGIAQKTVGISTLRNIFLPIPPLAEQHRIVARVNELMAKIDELETVEKELVALKKAFPGDMKASLLQAAMQGKLTQQLPEDGSAADLLASIKAEKEQLIKEKKIKKEKPLAPISADEIPFDIPDNWEWIRLGCLVQVISGTSYDKTKVQASGIRIARGGNLVNERIVLQDDDVFLPQDEFYDESKCLRKKDIVIVASTGSLTGIGRPAFCNAELKEPTQIGAFLRIVRCYDDSVYDYVKMIFKGAYYRDWISRVVSGIGIRNVKAEHITNLLIPLPPLAEQKRIVEKLDKLLPLCDALKEDGMA